METRSMIGLVAAVVILGIALVIGMGVPPSPPGAVGLPAQIFAHAILLAVRTGALAVPLVAAGCESSNVVECPAPIAASACPDLASTDIVGRCEEAWPGSAPRLVQRDDDYAPISCPYPPPDALFLARVGCKDSFFVEFWCEK